MLPPSGIYELICNGNEGTLELNVDNDGDIVDSKIDVLGQRLPISGTYDEINGLIEFTADGLHFIGYMMTLTSSSKSAFAGTGSQYLTQIEDTPMAPAENRFGWWAILATSNN